MSQAEQLPEDHARRLAVLDPGDSFCVTAPAGSGKTELLTQRVLRLLAQVDQPEEILAITFTRKAAAEMHHRIIEALRAAAVEPAPTEAHKQLSRELATAALARNQACDWQLLENTSRLKVQTIDSLCASLTRQMPILSHFGAQPQITDQAEPYYQQAVEQLLVRLESSGVVADALASLLGHIDNDAQRLQRLLVSMLQRRDQWLMHLGTGAEIAGARAALERTLQQVINDTLVDIRQQLQVYSGELVALMDYAGANLRDSEKSSPIERLAGVTALPDADAAHIEDWIAITELLLTKATPPGFRKKLDVNSGFPTKTADGDSKRARQRKDAMQALLTELADDPDLASAIAQVRSLPTASYPQQQWQVLTDLLTLLPVLVAELTLVFQQSGSVDHTQIALAALQGLGDATHPTELALKLDYRLRHILIDEFQDTSTTQFRLLERLVEGWSEHNRANPGSPNTLFLVGDGMQSIYGFRHANVGLFIEARHSGVNGVALRDVSLTVNFRSLPAVVNSNNEWFTSAFPARENLSRGAVPYAASIPHRRAAEDSEVRIFGVAGEEAEQREAARLVDLIVDLQQRAPEEDIAVLVRSRNHLKPLVRELSLRGLGWNATDIDPLANYACIVDLMSLTRALVNLADRVAWLALLRSPWFGLTNADLYVIFNQQPGVAVWQQLRQWQVVESALGKHARETLAIRIPVLERTIALRQRYPFREWLEGSWLSLGGAAALMDVREFEMVERFFDTLEQYQQSGSLPSLREFERAIERLYARPSANSSRLHLMTIHKSKGLEFDTVILPALGKGARSDDNALLMWREHLSAASGAAGLVIGAIPSSGESDGIYRHLKNEQSISQGLENTRLLYVAATRAIKRLYCSFCGELDEAQQPTRAPRKDSLLASIWDAVSEQVEWCVPEGAATGQLGMEFDAEQPDTAAQLHRLASRWQPPAWAFPNPLSDYYLNSDAGGDNLPAAAGDFVAVAVGNVVHALFESLQARGVNSWQTGSPQYRQLWVTRLLEQQGLKASEIEAAIAAVLLAVNNTLGDGRGRWLLSPSARTDLAEFTVSSCEAGAVRHRVIDRVLRDEQGVLWIVDYKTSQPLEGESRQSFLAREQQQYRAQLLDYQWHMQQLMPEENVIRMALYFTAIPLLCELQ